MSVMSSNTRKAAKETVNRSFQTRQIHAGQESSDVATSARAVPIYATSSFTFPDVATAAEVFAGRAEGNQYGRMHNPTVEVFVDRLVAMSGAVAGAAFASGQ